MILFRLLMKFELLTIHYDTQMIHSGNGGYAAIGL